MSGATELVLTAFEPALEELARRVDAGADPAGTVAAALALFQGIAATALLPGGLPVAAGQAESRWDGVLEDGRLSLIRPGCQFSATLGVGILQTAVLNGPACVTWSLFRSEKGLHVTVASPTGGTLHDLFIGPSGELRDERDTGGKLRRLKDEFDEINRRPIGSLPSGTPAGGASGADAFAAGFGEAAKSAAAAVAGAALSAAAGAAIRAATSGADAGNKAGPPVPPPPAPKRAAPGASPPLARGQGPKLTLTFPGGETTGVSSFPAVIGRTDETDIRLDSTRVSRRHAQLESDADGFWLADLGSANGTFRNDARLTARTRLEDGDQLRFADVILRVGIEGGAPPASMATVAFQIPEALHPAAPPPAKPPRQPPVAPKSAAAPPRIPPAPAPARSVAPPPLPPVPEPARGAPEPDVGGEKKPCRACGHRCPPEASFCRACGAPMEDGAESQAVRQPAQSPTAPSLRFPGFLFAVFFVIQAVIQVIHTSPDILLRPDQLKILALGGGLAVTAFLTGVGGGLFRVVALILSAAFCYMGIPGLVRLASAIASDPGILEVAGPMAAANLLSVLTALWILKRAIRFPK